MWKNLTDAEKAPYKVKAEAERRAHNVKHPNYVYRPSPRKKKTGKSNQGQEQSTTGSRGL